MSSSNLFSPTVLHKHYTIDGGRGRQTDKLDRRSMFAIHLVRRYHDTQSASPESRQTTTGDFLSPPRLRAPARLHASLLRNVAATATMAVTTNVRRWP
jgi:hypothetical protein